MDVNVMCVMMINCETAPSHALDRDHTHALGHRSAPSASTAAHRTPSFPRSRALRAFASWIPLRTCCPVLSLHRCFQARKYQTTMAKRKDFYDELGVSKDASPESISASFKKLAMQYHPVCFCALCVAWSLVLPTQTMMCAP